MARRSPSNSVTAQIRRAKNLGKSISPPEGLDLPTSRHRQIWDQLVSTRDHESWSASALHDLHTIAVTTVEVENLQKRLDSEGYVIESPHGNKPNPLVQIVDMLTKRILACKRLNGLSTNSKVSAALNATGISESDRQKHEKKEETSVLSLLS